MGMKPYLSRNLIADVFSTTVLLDMTYLGVNILGLHYSVAMMT